MPLHPQVAALLTSVEELGLPPLNELSPAEAREQASTVSRRVGPGPAPEVPRVEDFTVPVSAGSIAARRYAGPPPAIVVTAEYDPLRDEGVAYAEALKTAGVEVTHHHYDDVVHAFFSLPNVLERGNEAIATVGADIGAAVARASAPAAGRKRAGGIT